MLAKGSIPDLDVELMASAATKLLLAYAQPTGDPWEGSPFHWILSQSSRAKGAIGEALVAEWAQANGFSVSQPPDSECDRIIGGFRIEVKLSTLWRAGCYRFQQIRDQNYDYCFCLGLSPFDAHAWLLPKTMLKRYVIGHMGQHTGSRGLDTAWLGFQVDKPYEWMAAYGNRLAQVAKLLRENATSLHSPSE